MPTDYLQILRGITGGLEAGQTFRANRQIERGREQALESGEYDLQQRRAVRRVRDPESTKVLGALDPQSVKDFQETFGDPFALKLVDWFRQKRANRKRKTAVPAGATLYNSDLTTQSPDFGDPEFTPPEAPEFADGGPVARQEDVSEEDQLNAERAYRLYQAQQQAARNEPAAARARQQALILEGDKLREQRRANQGALSPGSSRFEGAVNEYVAPVLGPNFIPQEGAGSGGPRGGPSRRYLRDQSADRPSALPIQEPTAGSAAPATQGIATASGNTQSAPPARRQAAVPTASQEQRVDFSQLDVDAKDVPNMTTDDWKTYRAKLVDAARQSGRPEAIQQANNLVTQMQQEGFLSYGQQGFALQQAGNLKGAMAAYRAAFQYFPNGNDVEFGLIKDSQGQQQIVGFGRDEKTNKVVQGSQIVMTGEQVSKLLENFTKPEAFRAWTKDWRDFEEGKRRFDASLKDKQGDDAFRERRYSEVEKPLAQAQADSLANRGEADILRAEKSGTPTMRPRDLQGSERTFRERLQLVGYEDQTKADQLASIMSRIKTSSPDTPDNVIINAVVAADRDGTLPQRLKQLGIQ